MKFVRQARALLSRGFAAAIIAATAMIIPPAHAGTMITLHSFCAEANCVDGAMRYDAVNGLVLDTDGNLYGATEYGGTMGSGVVFELRRLGNGHYRYIVIYNFCSQPGCSDGAAPHGSLVLDTSGNLYGFAKTSDGRDTIYELLRNGGTPAIQILHTFCAHASCADGSGPVAGLTYAGSAAGNRYDGASPLFGTTLVGGAADHGTVYQLRPRRKGWGEEVIYSFCSEPDCRDGDSPYAPPFADNLGNLYGTTAFGGAVKRGTIFELRTVHHVWRERVLDSFCKEHNHCPDGVYPNQPLAMDGAGNLVGFDYRRWVRRPRPALHCRAIACYLIYALTPGNRTHTVLYNFCPHPNDCPDGILPDGRPVIDSSGNIFGVTEFNHDTRSGTLFELSGSTLQVLYTFCRKKSCAGSVPSGGIIRDAAGAIYGMTRLHGRYGYGTVYKYVP